MTRAGILNPTSRALPQERRPLAPIPHNHQAIRSQQTSRAEKRRIQSRPLRTPNKMTAPKISDFQTENNSRNGSTHSPKSCKSKSSTKKLSLKSKINCGKPKPKLYALAVHHHKIGRTQTSTNQETCELLHYSSLTTRRDNTSLHIPPRAVSHTAPQQPRPPQQPVPPSIRVPYQWEPAHRVPQVRKRRPGQQPPMHAGGGPKYSPDGTRKIPLPRGVISPPLQLDRACPAPAPRRCTP